MSNMSYAESRKLADELPLMIHRLAESQKRMSKVVEGTLERMAKSDMEQWKRLESLLENERTEQKASQDVLTAYIGGVLTEVRVTNRLLSELVAMQRHLFTDGAFDLEARKALKQAEQRVY